MTDYRMTLICLKCFRRSGAATLNQPRGADGGEAGGEQRHAAIEPRHFVDHEALARVGEISRPLAHPDQADQNGEDTAIEQGFAHGASIRDLPRRASRRKRAQPGGFSSKADSRFASAWACSLVL